MTENDFQNEKAEQRTILTQFPVPITKIKEKINVFHLLVAQRCNNLMSKHLKYSWKLSKEQSIVSIDG